MIIIAASIFSLFGEIFVDNDRANEAINETDEKAEKTAGTFSKLGGVATKVGGLLAAGVAAGATAMVGLMGKTMETANQINKFSQVTGMTTKGFQEWDHVAKSVGFSMEAAAGDMAALAERAMDAASGAGENAEMFKKLGVSVTDNNGVLKTQEQLFNETITGLQEMENVTERNAIATAMLSTTGEELAPILNMTNEELQKLKGNAAVISEEDLAKAAKFNEKWIEAKTTMGNVVSTIGFSLMPMFQTMLDWVIEHMPQIQAVFSAVFNVINLLVGGLVKGIQWVIGAITNWFTSNETALNGIQSKFAAIMPMIKQFAENAFNGVINVATAVWNFFKANLLPIFTSLFTWIQGNMPTIRATVTAVFNKVVEVARGVWSFFTANLLPIFVRLSEFIRSNMPQIQRVIETVFGIIVTVVKAVWGVIENLLLPILKALWDWISPHIPKIQKVIQDAFGAIFDAVELVVGIFEKVSSAIKTAVDWLGQWNDKPSKKKTVEIEEKRTSSGGSGGAARNATGTNYFPGGQSLVGEMGPELVTLPRGSKIDPANVTRNKMGGGNTYNINVSGSNVDVAKEVVRNLQRMEVLYG